MINQVRVIAITQPVVDFIHTPEELITYCAKVSNPSGQTNMETSERLLRYCVNKKHWSVFTMANAILEIETTRDIARQFTRHDSLTVIEHEPGEFVTRPDGFDYQSGGIQEFSLRYASALELTDREARFQDRENRQMSTPADHKTRDWFLDGLRMMKAQVRDLYDSWLQAGVAKECARVILPEGLTPSRLYVNGTVRSWTHYLDVRLYGEGVQLEHRELAQSINDALKPHFPGIFR